MAMWTATSLGDVVGLQRGHDLPTSARRPGEVPIIGSLGLAGSHDESLYPGPGVAIGRSGNIGTATYVESAFWPLNTCLFVKDFKGNDPRWVFRLLDWIDFEGFNSGSAQPSLNRNYLRHIPVLVPPLTEQEAIAEVLGALDDKITANARRESTAALLIEAMYNRAVGAPGTATEPLMNVLNVAFGEAFGGSQFAPPGNGRPLIRIRDLKTFRSQVWTTESRPKEVLVQPGDVVVGMDAEFRPTWWLGGPGLLNQRVCRVTSEGAGPAFVREVLRAPMGRIEGYKTGTTVIHLNKSDLVREEVLWPDADVRAKFDREAAPVLHSLVASAQERQKMDATRDALLPQLMSGKIRVKDAERVVEGVV